MPIEPDYILVQVAAPSGLPVSIDEVKAALRIDGNARDDYLTLLITTAVEALDGRFGYLGQCLMQQDWKVLYSTVPPTGVIELPIGPVIDVTDISVHDGVSAVSQNLASYRVTKSRFKTTVTPVSVVWPALLPREDALQITVRAGGAAVSAPVKMAILGMVSMLFADTGAAIDWQRFESLLTNERRTR